MKSSVVAFNLGQFSEAASFHTSHGGVSASLSFLRNVASEGLKSACVAAIDYTDYKEGNALLGPIKTDH
jgi:hypothetical protein